MSNPFDSPRLTILRAQHHIDDVNAKVTEFITNQPWSHRVENDNQNPRNELHKIVFERRLPANLPNIVFDAAMNLRAVLDQCGYASAIASGKADPKSTYFPIGEDADGLEKAVIGRGRCKDLPAEILTLFRGFKPYKGGNDAIWALNRLCNTNKHATLAPFDLGQFDLSALQEVTKTIRPLPGGGGQIIIEGNLRGFTGRITPSSSSWDPDKHEITIWGVPREASPQYKASVALNVAIEGIDTLSRKPVVAVFGEMMRVVDGILSATEAECRRLGFLK
jgi:hypothetical protein